jgi:tetratricopeptide (TPR) repeat protein
MKNRILASGVVVLLAWGSALADAVERDLRQALGYAHRGLSSLQKGNGARALEDFDRALAKVPDLPDAHMGLGHLAMRDKRFEDALREYRTAQEGFRKLAALLKQFTAERYVRSRDELDQLRIVKSQLDREAMQMQSRGTNASSSSTGSMSVGQIERERAEIEQKIRALESMGLPSEDRTPEAPAKLYFFEGNALFDLGRLDEALAAWERAAKGDPSLAPVQNNLAVAYWRKGRISEAQRALHRAETLGFKVNPNFRADLSRASQASLGQPSR